ncbi:MAG: hypothetical protein RSD22_08155 [Romboutsia sp.]
MSKKVSYGGILLALNLVLLLLINIVPMNTLFLMSLASLPISIVIMEWGPKMGVAFYIGSTVLSFIIINSKVQFILYTFSFGIYGLLKYVLERYKYIYIEYLLKIVCANFLVMVLYFILNSFVYIPVNLFTIITFQIVFMVYDYMYSRFIYYYNDKLRKILKI